LDPEAYKRFIEQQKRKKLEYISEKGFEGYEEYLEDLNRGENKFLEEQGMDFNRYNEFAADYVPKAGTEDPLLPEADDPFDSTPDTDDPFDESPDLKEPETRPSNGYKFDWANIPRDLWPIITQLTGEEPPAQ
jgi:hypothetical protein